jgi:phosphatidylserine synthase 2
LLLDLFGCNALGIYLGALSCNYLYVRRMNWIYDKPDQQASMAPQCSNKVATFVRKFSPNVWTKYDWSVFSTATRYNQFLFYCFFCLGIDCMNFFMKFILFVPADHTLLKARLFIWACVSIAASKEYYEFISNRHCKRVGPFVWLACLCLGVEFSITIKFGRQMFTTPFPWYVQLMWAVIGSLMLAGWAYSYSNGRKQEKEEKRFDPQEPTIDIEPIYATSGDKKKKVN